MSNDLLLSVEGLNVHYGRAQAVRNVNLPVRRQEIVAILGANGAGKSSTLNALMGLVRQVEGRVVFNGTSIAGMAPERIARLGLSLVFEGRRIFPQLTVGENLMMGGRARGGRRPGDNLLEEIHEMFPILANRHKQMGGSLSGGEQQMLAIGRALMSAPHLLMLDEPSLGLAPRIVDQTFELILRLRDAGHTILLIEQNVQLSLEIADRVHVMNLGEIVAQGTADELRSSDEIAQAYLGGGE